LHSTTLFDTGLADTQWLLGLKASQHTYIQLYLISILTSRHCLHQNITIRLMSAITTADQNDLEGASTSFPSTRWLSQISTLPQFSTARQLFYPPLSASPPCTLGPRTLGPFDPSTCLALTSTTAHLAREERSTPGPCISHSGSPRARCLNSSQSLPWIPGGM
jgi:hypothetical protein